VTPEPQKRGRDFTDELVAQEDGNGQAERSQKKVQKVLGLGGSGQEGSGAGGTPGWRLGEAERAGQRGKRQGLGCRCRGVPRVPQGAMVQAVVQRGAQQGSVGSVTEEAGGGGGEEGERRGKRGVWDDAPVV